MIRLRRLRPIAVWSLALITSMILLWTSARAALSASRQLQISEQRWTNVAARAAESQSLQERVAEWLTPVEAEGALAPKLTEALTASGLAASALSNVSPQGDQVLASTLNSQAVRTKASVTLTGVTLRRLGIFLSNWTEKNKGWAVTSLDLSPEPQPSAQPGVSSQGGDLPIRVLMTIESLRLERKGPKT